MIAKVRNFFSTKETEPTEHERRDEVIADLDKHPGWAALKDLLLQSTRYERTNFDDPQWAARSAHRQGRIEQALDMMKIVTAAVERVKARKAKESAI